jgi:hypothetical protein
MEVNAYWLLLDDLIAEMRRIPDDRNQASQELRQAISKECCRLLQQASWVPSMPPEVLLQLMLRNKKCVPLSVHVWCICVQVVHALEGYGT